MTWFQARDYCLDQVPVLLDQIRYRCYQISCLILRNILAEFVGEIFHISTTIKIDREKEKEYERCKVGKSYVIIQCMHPRQTKIVT